ncbi:MAG: hypothetical protein AABZ74_06665 [Cyanobacteriota bacterium]
MKIKRYLLLVAFLTFFSCNDKKIEEIKPIIKNSIEPSVLPSKNVIENPKIETTIKPDFTGLDVYGENIYCEKRSNIKIKLDKPVNIAVKRDGSEVYVVNGKCGRKPYFYDLQPNLYNEYCHYEPDYTYILDDSKKTEYTYTLVRKDNPNKKDRKFEYDIYSDTVENNPIYRISQNKTINLLYGDNSENMYCSNDGVINIDNYDNLYFSANKKIFKVVNNKDTKEVADLDELERKNDIMSENSILSNKSMIKKISVKDSNIFFSVGNNLKPKRISSEIPKAEIIRSSYGFNDYYHYGADDHASYNNFINHNNILRSVGVIENQSSLRYIANLFSYEKLPPFIFEIKDNFLISNEIMPSINDPKTIESNIDLIKMSYLSNYNNISIDRKILLPYSSWREYIYKNEKGEIAISSGFDNLYSNFSDIKINSKGEMFLNEIMKNRIWKVDNDNKITIFIGTWDGKIGYKDGKSNEALFNHPSGMAFDGQDNLYVADTGNNAIRKITPDGEVSTFYKEKD